MKMIHKEIVERFKIDNVAINKTNLDEVVREILNKSKDQSSNYICVTNVYACYIGNHNKNYQGILNNSFITIPDGKPLEWYAKINGEKHVKRISGSDLFIRLCELTENKNYTHFFYGSTPDTISKLKINLKKKFPGLKTLGFVSPPFMTAEELATNEIINQINTLKPNFVWVGLGAPKQEYFMDLIAKKIDSSILIGIGLVFDYQAEIVKRAPNWVQELGLEWSYRLIQQPTRLWHTVRPFGWMLFKILKLILRRIK